MKRAERQGPTVNHTTVLALADINRRFYTQHAQEFGQTRQAPWVGWKRVVDRLEARAARSEPLRVLDLGCGNGRFLHYLARRGLQANYAGVDRVLPSIEQRPGSDLAIETSWHAHDFIVGASPLPASLSDDFDLVAVFGVLHHVPSFAQRKRLLAALADRLTRRGLLAVTLWQFGARERFRSRTVDWHQAEAVTGIPVDPQQLESGDFLLAWGQGKRTARYCHYTTPPEWQALVADLDLLSVDEFLADGNTQDLNAYQVMRHAG